MLNNRALVYADTRDMDRDAWLEARRGGIGGSDAASIMGVNKWSSPLAVYADKLGLAPEKETSEAMRIGNDLEEYVARRFTDATGIKLRRMNKILQHPEHKWMLANIDRDVVGEEAGFEAKTTNMLNKYDFEAGEVPLVYQWQCQHYMAVTGAPCWYLAVLVLGVGFYTFRIERNDSLIEKLIEAEREFWEEHVLKRIPPLPTGCDADDDAIGMIYPDSRAETADLFSMTDIFDAIALLKADRDALDKRIAEKEEMIKLALAGRESGTAPGWKVSYKPVISHRIDSKRLKAEQPDIAALYSSESTSRPFKITKVKVKGA